jgi:hypothetical protein
VVGLEGRRMTWWETTVAEVVVGLSFITMTVVGPG